MGLAAGLQVAAAALRPFAGGRPSEDDRRVARAGGLAGGRRHLRPGLHLGRDLLPRAVHARVRGARPRRRRRDAARHPRACRRAPSGDGARRARAGACDPGAHRPALPGRQGRHGDQRAVVRRRPRSTDRGGAAAVREPRGRPGGAVSDGGGRVRRGAGQAARGGVGLRGLPRRPGGGAAADGDRRAGRQRALGGADRPAAGRAGGAGALRGADAGRSRRLERLRSAQPGAAAHPARRGVPGGGRGRGAGLLRRARQAGAPPPPTRARTSRSPAPSCCSAPVSA